MSDVLRGLAISAGILIPVVVFIVLISMAVVRRGEGGEVGDVVDDHNIPDSPIHVKESAAAPAAKAAKATAPASEDISVIDILLFGTGLFVLSILALLALSLIQHMS